MNNQEKKKLFEALQDFIRQNCITEEDLVNIAVEIKSVEDYKRVSMENDKQRLLGRCFMYINPVDLSRYYFKVVSTRGDKPEEVTALFFREGPGYINNRKIKVKI